MTAEVNFSFQPRWKEELLCECELGQVVLDMPMGVTSVYAPSKQEWIDSAPAWAVDLWEPFNAQLEAWCGAHGVPHYPGSGGPYFTRANHDEK